MWRNKSKQHGEVSKRRVRERYSKRGGAFFTNSICWTIYCLILLTGRLPFIILDPEIRSVVVRAYERNFNERRRGGREKKRKKFVKILNLWPKLDRRLNDRNYRNYYFGLSVTCFRAILSRYCANRDESIVYYFSIGTKIGWIGYYRRCVRDRASFLARALRRELSSTLRGRKLWTSAVFFIPLADTSIPESRRTRSIFSWKCPVTRYAAKKRGKSGGEKEGTWKKKWKRKKREKNKSRIARTINEKSLYKRARDV